MGVLNKYLLFVVFLMGVGLTSCGDSSDSGSKGGGTGGGGTNNAAGDDSLCPTHFVYVSPLSPYTATGFCVAKFEMKNVGGVATSQPANLPWVSISRNASITACQNLGSKYNLISNAQWQTVAMRIENVTTNWAGGIVGSTGGISMGHSDNSPANLLAASTDDNDSCFGTGETCNAATWSAQRRTFLLNTGSAVWDLSGNAWEWTLDDNNGTDLGLSANISTITAANLPVVTTIGGVSGNTKYHFGTAGDYTALSTAPHGGLGYATLTASDNVGGIGRGGSFSGDGGVFTTYPGLSVNLGSNETGFRCVYTP